MLTGGRRLQCLARLFEVVDSPLGRKTLKNINENRVRLGDIEADVWNIVVDELVHHGNDRLLDDVEAKRRGECLDSVSRLLEKAFDKNLQRLRSMWSFGRDSLDVVPWP